MSTTSCRPFPSPVRRRRASPSSCATRPRSAPCSAITCWWPTTSDGHWGDPAIVPYGPMHLPPAPGVAHYGQGIFEGFKAFPRAGRRRGAVPARRQSRPHEPHVPAHGDAGDSRRRSSSTAPRALVARGSAVDSRQAGQRPLHPAGDVRDRRAARRAAVGAFRFIIETCPSGPYFSGTVDLLAEETYVRAFPGGTGAAKCGGNYAGSMLAAREAQKKGFHNVLWLDGIERRYVEEAGLMNVVFVIDGTVVTPPLVRHHPARHHARQRADAAARDGRAGRRAPHHDRRSVRGARHGHGSRAPPASARRRPSRRSAACATRIARSPCRP